MRAFRPSSAHDKMLYQVMAEIITISLMLERFGVLPYDCADYPRISRMPLFAACRRISSLIC